MTCVKRSVEPGKEDSFRCLMCNSTQARIKRLCDGNEYLNMGYKSFDHTDRKELMQKAQFAFDHTLEKLLNESVAQCLWRRRTDSFKMQGP